MFTEYFIMWKYSESLIKIDQKRNNVVPQNLKWRRPGVRSGITTCRLSDVALLLRPVITMCRYSYDLWSYVPLNLCAVSTTARWIYVPQSLRFCAVGTTSRCNYGRYSYTRQMGFGAPVCAEMKSQLTCVFVCLQRRNI